MTLIRVVLEAGTEAKSNWKRVGKGPLRVVKAAGRCMVCVGNVSVECRLRVRRAPSERCCNAGQKPHFSQHNLTTGKTLLGRKKCYLGFFPD